MKSVNASAGGAFLGGIAGQSYRLTGARLVGGSNAATATIREVDGSGRILVVLAAAAGAADDFEPAEGVDYVGNVHVTLTGTAPTLHLFEP